MRINTPINLKLTQESGQTSQPPWSVIDNSYCSVILHSNIPILIKVSQKDINSLNINYELPIAKKDIDIDENLLQEKVNKIYDLDFDLNKFYGYLSEDSKLKPAIDFCRGLRLFIAKDPFECVISSICSANNSIKRWTKSIAIISSKWGEKHDFPSTTFYSFPKPNILMNVYENELIESEIQDKSIENCLNNLKSCGVGYRLSYIKKTSEIIKSEINLFEVSKMNYDEAFETILKLPGVGPKVADCILLYGFGMKEAFPSDIWIKRIISYLYFNGKDISANKVRDFGMEKFKDYGGYVQLYLFHYARKSGLMTKLKKK
jgi:N-glycosylase/DNA lyase